jgi:hypothetical protein
MKKKVKIDPSKFCFQNALTFVEEKFHWLRCVHSGYHGNQIKNYSFLLVALHHVIMPLRARCFQNKHLPQGGGKLKANLSQVGGGLFCFMIVSSSIITLM